MLPDAKGKREAQRIAKEWLDALNAEADLMPNAGKASTVDKTFMEYLKHQLDTCSFWKWQTRKPLIFNGLRVLIFASFWKYYSHTVRLHICNGW